MATLKEQNKHKHQNEKTPLQTNTKKINPTSFQLS